MAKKSTLKVNKIVVKKVPVYKFMVVAAGETITILADEVYLDDDFIKCFLRDEEVAVFKSWHYFMRLEEEKPSSITPQDYDGQPA